jgi:hypothetical protein
MALIYPKNMCHLNQSHYPVWNKRKVINCFINIINQFYFVSINNQFYLSPFFPEDSRISKIFMFFQHINGGFLTRLYYFDQLVNILRFVLKTNCLGVQDGLAYLILLSYAWFLSNVEKLYYVDGIYSTFGPILTS